MTTADRITLGLAICVLAMGAVAFITVLGLRRMDSDPNPCPWWRLWRRHKWSGGKQYGWDGTPFSMSPVFGERVCVRCGKRQRFLYDSQGGAWETVQRGRS